MIDPYLVFLGTMDHLFVAVDRCAYATQDNMDHAVRALRQRADIIDRADRCWPDRPTVETEARMLRALADALEQHEPAKPEPEEVTP